MQGLAYWRGAALSECRELGCALSSSGTFRNSKMDAITSVSGFPKIHRGLFAGLARLCSFGRTNR
jgi:hypothetical protein